VFKNLAYSQDCLECWHLELVYLALSCIICFIARILLAYHIHRAFFSNIRYKKRFFTVSMVVSHSFDNTSSRTKALGWKPFDETGF
jgi:hypothetical protein